MNKKLLRFLVKNIYCIAALLWLISALMYHDEAMLLFGVLMLAMHWMWR